VGRVRRRCSRRRTAELIPAETKIVHGGVPRQNCADAAAKRTISADSRQKTLLGEVLSNAIGRIARTRRCAAGSIGADLGEVYMPEICLRWMDNFEVGIDDLDADHRHMYLQINTICEATAAGDMDVVARQLSAFVEFAAAHIERETRVLTALDPGRVFAGTALDRLKPISDLAGRFTRGEQDVAQIPAELVDWFCRQTIDHDAAIRARFHRRSSTACLRLPVRYVSAVGAREAKGVHHDGAQRSWTETETVMLAGSSVATVPDRPLRSYGRR